MCWMILPCTSAPCHPRRCVINVAQRDVSSTMLGASAPQVAFVPLSCPPTVKGMEDLSKVGVTYAKRFSPKPSLFVSRPSTRFLRLFCVAPKAAATFQHNLHTHTTHRAFPKGRPRTIFHLHLCAEAQSESTKVFARF